MTRQTDLALTALAPAIWGSTYIVTTELLPPGHPLGMVLSRRWTPPVSPLTFTAWQLAAGGLLLLPLALWLEPPLPALDRGALLGLLWLGLAGAVLTYAIWFRGLARLGPASLSVLGFVSPLSAVLLGWAIAGQTLSPQQIIGAATVLGSVWLGQWALRPAPARPAPQPAPLRAA